MHCFMKAINKNEKSGIIYGSNGNVFIATTHNLYGRDLEFVVNEEDCLDMFDVNIDDILHEIETSQLHYGLRFFEPEVVEEATNIKLPLNSEKDLKGLSYIERSDKINNTRKDIIQPMSFSDPCIE